PPTPVNPPTPGPPFVKLTRIPPAEWQKPFEPTPPVRSDDNPNVVRFTYGTYPSPSGQKVLVGQFLGQLNQVFQNGMLKVDLVNSEGKAYLKLSQSVAVVPGGSGLDIRVKLPRTLGSNHKGVAVSFVPQNLQSEAVALEMVSEATSLLKTNGPERVLQLGLRNPTGSIAADPEVAVELLDAIGMPLGTWRGRLEGVKIEPGKVQLFRARLKVARDVTPGRLVVRAYGRVFP
ncbi:MAG: hypothetical protein R3236_08515, partial [Phycisphaeraceae bacterium]|nr:hypothetical protein [Phycisphaeraceae bacterium]